ncbi:MAG: prepilin-type N-terminal cleavage/methylation domain-containing protein [Candidatus Omnitrophica bacterium]|nr:prepilin-type N-terminal cleavage/methylation domain-containing protein [Candidatus Omnitrophota bacterium]
MRIKRIEELEAWKIDKVSQIDSGLIKSLFNTKRNNAKTQRRKNGFTLVEILIAIAVLSMGVALFFNAFTQGMKGILAGQRRVIAVNYAQQVMEKYVMPKKFNDLVLGTYYVNNATAEGFKLQYMVNYVNSLNLDQIVSSGDYKRILVSVIDNRGIVPQVNLIMLKTDYEGLE